MIGILLLSHGKMAEGMLNSSTLFFGNEIPQIKALCLEPNDSPEEFDERIKEAIKEVDEGNGVVALVDLFGGTPGNRCSMLLNDRMHVITGMNFPMLLELLNMRMFTEDVKDIDYNSFKEIGKDGIHYLNDLFNKEEETGLF